MTKIIDARTRAYYEELTARQAKTKFTPYPKMLVDYHAMHGQHLWRPKISTGHSGLYGEWYRCLAYLLYGYGNISNNDRRRSGLKPARKYRL